MWKVQVLVGGREVQERELSLGSECIVGRDVNADLVVGERSVSRRHCRLAGREDGVRIEDLGSANKVLINGREVTSGTLDSGEEAHIGMARLRVTRSAAQTGMIPIQGLMGEPSTKATPLTGSSSTDRSVVAMGRDAYEGLEKERLGILIETGKSLSSSLDLDSLLGRIMDHLFEILPVRRGVVALLDGEGNLVARHARPSGDFELSEICSQQIIREVMASGRARVIEDASMVASLAEAQSILASNIKAAICAPLVSGERCIGAIYADYPGRARLYGESDLEFFAAFAAIAAVAIENSRMLAELEMRERDRRDEEIAERVQLSLLPDQNLRIPGMDVDFAYCPARVVGGDFYDLVAVDDGRLALILGDVSGKSIGAALFMARLMSFFRATLPADPSPGSVLTRTNALLGTRADQVMFATAICCLIDQRSRRIWYASAGHNPGLVLLPDGDGWRELHPNGMPLAVLGDTVYEGQELELPPGSLIVLYTDGIVEARDREGEMFGLDRVRQIIQEQRGEGARTITLNLLNAVAAHSKDSPHQLDDIALVVVKVASDS